MARACSEPPRILSASTRDLRSETLRAGPPCEGACLRRYNPPERLPADEDLRAHVRAGGEQAVRALAGQAGVTEASVRRWLDQPGCDEVGDRLLATLRRNVPEPAPRFAAGFTTLMAGTMLAAETAKLLLGQPVSSGKDAANNVTFQFLKPASAGNSAPLLARDPGCTACRASDRGDKQLGPPLPISRASGQTLSLGPARTTSRGPAEQPGARRSCASALGMGFQPPGA